MADPGGYDRWLTVALEEAERRAAHARERVTVHGTLAQLEPSRRAAAVLALVIAGLNAEARIEAACDPAGSLVGGQE